MVFRLGEGAAQIFCHSARAEVLWGRRRTRRGRRRGEEGHECMTCLVGFLCLLVMVCISSYLVECDMGAGVDDDICYVVVFFCCV